MPERERLSDTLKDFNAEVSRLDNAARYGIRRAVLAAKVPSDPPSRKLADGKIVKRYDVDMSGIIEALPPEMKLDGKTLSRAVAQECNFRGDAWTAEGLYLALEQFLDCGNPTPPEAAATPPTTPPAS